MKYYLCGSDTSLNILSVPSSCHELHRTYLMSRGEEVVKVRTTEPCQASRDGPLTSNAAAKHSQLCPKVPRVPSSLHEELMQCSWLRLLSGDIVREMEAWSPDLPAQSWKIQLFCEVEAVKYRPAGHCLARLSPESVGCTPSGRH